MALFLSALALYTGDTLSNCKGKKTTSGVAMVYKKNIEFNGDLVRD